MMTEEEVNAWYDEEKQKIFDIYMNAVETKDQKAAVKDEEKFKKEMQKVRKKYEEMYVKSLTPGKAKEYSTKIRKFMDGLVKIYK